MAVSAQEYMLSTALIVFVLVFCDYVIVLTSLGPSSSVISS